MQEMTKVRDAAASDSKIQTARKRECLPVTGPPQNPDFILYAITL
jgi:hypothetical protein